MKKLTVIIPTYNEEVNIKYAVQSVVDFVDQVLVVDSFSTDNTVKIATSISKKVDVISIKFTTFAEKMNSALQSNKIHNDWVMRLDADEVVINPENFFYNLRHAFDNNSSHSHGYYINRQYYFLGKWVKHGGMFPRYVLRIFNRLNAYYEAKNVDEKVMIDGHTQILPIYIADQCHKGVLTWVKKHIKYAYREAVDVTCANSVSKVNIYDLEFDNHTQKKKNLYYRTPVLIRPIIYFIYRFIIQGGCLDGLRGWLYHFLHAFIYRELVDIQIIKLLLLQKRQNKT